MLNYLHSLNQDLNTELLNFIRDGEDHVGTAYFDTVDAKKATIGFGFNLTNNLYRGFVLSQIGVDQSHFSQYHDVITEQTNAFSTALAALPSNATNLQKNTVKNQHSTQLQNALNNLHQELYQTAFGITTPQSRYVFDAIIAHKASSLDPKLGIGTSNPLVEKNSDEYVALMDMYYNAESLIGNNILTALKNNDRVAVWFDIRYGNNPAKASNNYLRSNGIQRRRDSQAEKFHLYSNSTGSSPINANEAKHVYRFLESKRGFVESYYNNAGLTSYTIDGFNTSVEPAKTFLINNFNQGVNIDGEIVIGNGVGVVPQEFSDLSEGSDASLNGSLLNDLIFGERGEDVLYGYYGNDVLYGGLGNDNLYGGIGDDTYVFNKGDGRDKIFDTEGNHDVLVFGNGITFNDLVFDASGPDLRIGIKEVFVTDINQLSDVVTIKDYYFTSFSGFEVGGSFYGRDDVFGQALDAFGNLEVNLSNGSEVVDGAVGDYQVSLGGEEMKIFQNCNYDIKIQQKLVA